MNIASANTASVTPKISSALRNRRPCAGALGPT
jgi:hypothetical protein